MRSPLRFRTRSSRVAVIGAGQSGIAAAVKLKKAGYDNFTVFERSGGAGGTWYDSKFPGAAVDVHSYCYSYPFVHHDWKKNHADASQVRDYLDTTIDKFGVRDHFRFNTEVQSAVWDDRTSSYDLTLADGQVLSFDFVVSCLGLLNNPKLATWPGLEDFDGPAFHSARWDTTADLSDKKVAVVGMGSSAAQIVPALAPNVKEVHLFARTPSWVLPKDVREFTAGERARYAKNPIYRRWIRYHEFKVRENPEITLGYRRAEGPEQEAVKAKALAYLEASIEDPELRQFLTPSFPLGCKRIILDKDFYPALNRDNVHVIPSGVASVDEKGIIDDRGEHHQVDAIVMATGFTTTQFLASLEVRGRAGRTVQEVWGLSPRAFCGMTVPGIPNFFMLYGPNTNGGISLMSNSARQAEAVVSTIRRMERRGKKAFDTRASALKRWIAWMDEGNAKRTSSHLEFCDNYYHSPEGQNVTQLPIRYVHFYLALKAWFPFGLKLQAR